MFDAKKRRWRANLWRDELSKYVYSKQVEVDGWRVGASDSAKVHEPRFDDSKWKLAKRGELLGKIDQFIWLRNTVAIPADFAGGEVVLHIDVQAEGAIFGQRGLVYVDGEETVGLDKQHKDVVLARRARGGEKFHVAAEIYTGPVESFSILAFGNQRNFLSKTMLGPTELRLVNPAGYKAYYDFAAAVDILEAMEKGSRHEAEILAAISDATNLIDLGADEARRNASFRAASKVLEERLFSGQKGQAQGEVLMVGQSHIDMAWLWPRRETIRKCASTMANTLSLQKRYPFFNFSHSQAQGFQWLKDRYPKLYARTKQAARRGRVEAVGGMWVEADLNCAGGEALARQFLYGQRFFQKEFGQRSRVGWLVDTFGYTWGLPQILKESGLDYFVSTKPTWNDTNVFPFTTFWWEGPDGSRVLTQIPPLTYGSSVTTKAIIETLDKNKEARLPAAPAFLFGMSDGGGGSSVMDLENLKRLQTSPYTPKMTVTTVRDYFDGLPREVAYPVYCDEMYVETHRGTLTSQSRTKRNNRKAEYRLFTAEVSATVASLLGAPYPGDELESTWKSALFSQFHDILPGSSIALVYEDADRDYAKVFESTDKITDKALSFMASNIDTTGPGKAYLVFNPTNWERTDIVEIEPPAKSCRVTESDGQELAFQKVAGKPAKIAVLVTVPGCGWKVIRVVEGKASESDALSETSGRAVETPFYSLRLGASGRIERLFDKSAQREVVAEGETANNLVMFEDIPVEYEAWDIDEWTQEKARDVTDLTGFKVLENGPVRTVIRLEWKAGRSTIKQQMKLYGHTRRIDFATEVDWRERKTLLKAFFPVAVRARRATYEIAFGAIDRSTKESNPWNWARFEVPAQKWADLSQADYGVSLLNDGKYGHSTKDNVMSISLLRSPECPDPEADQGRQEFVYSILPHRGSWQAGRTVEEGLELNVPLLAKAVGSSGGGLPPEGWLLGVEAEDGGEVVLSALKKCEDSNDYVVRLYEPHGRQTKVTIRTPFEVVGASRVNFLEEEKGKLRAGKSGVTLELLPWKVETVKLTLK